jgi:ankyrin repeat protein
MIFFLCKKDTSETRQKKGTPKNKREKMMMMTRRSRRRVPLCLNIFFIFSFLILKVVVNGQQQDLLSGEAQTAARRGDLEYFTTLLEVVDDPISFLNHQEQATEQTPLLAAVLAGQTEIVKQLLETGVDVTIPEKDGYTVMHAAAFQGRAEVVKLLLAYGIDANDVSASDGFTPFHRTLWTNSERHVETMRVFLEDGKVEVDFVSHVGKTGALIATELKHTKVLDILLREYGADPNFRNKRGDALVHVAIRAQDEKTLDMLLNNGADITLEDAKGKSCRKIAKQLRSKAVLERINRAFEELNTPNPNDNDRKENRGEEL